VNTAVVREVAIYDWIAVDIGLGRGKATAWTCDLTHEYVDINGSYRS
jgi:N-acetylglutamate synthase/N-acetylornithine aminotransferase